MKDNVIKVFKDIIYCPNIEQYYSKENNVCYDIIKSQEREQKTSFQVTYEWDENSIIEYFYKRFEKNFQDGIRKIMKNGSYEPVQYLSNIKKRVKEIFELINKEFTPGIDYCLTEIVHCKSNGGEGVGKAVVACEIYLKELLRTTYGKRFEAFGGSGCKTVAYSQNVRRSNF